MLQPTFLGPKMRQVVAASSAGMLLTGMMCTWGFPAAALPQMDEPDSVIQFTPQEASWFATVTLLMCIPGSLMGATAYECVGPRRMMLALIPLLCVSTMVMSVASWTVVVDAGAGETLLLICRIVQSSIVAILNPFIAIYTYEVSDQHLRGTLTSNVEIWATLGFVLCYIAGCFLTWSTIAWLLPLITLIPAFIGIFMSPESPLWMARKGREEEARAILILVRCTQQEAAADLKTVRSQLENANPTCSETLRMATKRSNVKAMVASCLLLIMKELGGYAVLAIYVVYIFDEAGVGMDPRWSSVVVGVTRLIFNCFASFLMYNLPRKLILIFGNTLTGSASLALGVFFYLQSKGEDVSWLSWLPLVGLMVHMIGAASAIGPTTWTVAVEVLPGPVRSLGFGLATTSYATAAFIISKSLLDLQTLVGLQGVFWLFTGGSIGYIVLVLLYIPETHGRSLQDIEDYWDTTTTKKEKKAVFV